VFFYAVASPTGAENIGRVPLAGTQKGQFGFDDAGRRAGIRLEQMRVS
jgi:hypothetical protein